MERLCQLEKNFFRAKLKDRKQWIEGFYCRINETTYCTTDDYQKRTGQSTASNCYRTLNRLGNAKPDSFFLRN